MSADQSLREQRRVQRVLARIHALIKAGEWEIRFTLIEGNAGFCAEHEISLACVGLCDYGAQRLYVDYRQDVLATIVHECLHAVYDDLVEDMICELEKLVMKYLTAKQARELYFAAGNILA